MSAVAARALVVFSGEDFWGLPDLFFLPQEMSWSTASLLRLDLDHSSGETGFCYAGTHLEATEPGCGMKIFME